MAARTHIYIQEPFIVEMGALEREIMTLSCKFKALLSYSPPLNIVLRMPQLDSLLNEQK